MFFMPILARSILRSLRFAARIFPLFPRFLFFALACTGCLWTSEESGPEIRILSHPVDDTLPDGDNLRFTVVAEGRHGSTEEGAYDIVWYRNDTLLAGFYATLDYPARYAENGSLFRAEVRFDRYSAKSQSARLTVLPRPPILESAVLREVGREGFAEPPRSGRAYRLQANGKGSEPSYRWQYKGVWTALDTARNFGLGTVRKSDSGQVVTCIMINALGSDTLRYTLSVMYEPWRVDSIWIGVQKSPLYGSLVNFDTTGSARAMFAEPAKAVQEELDLVGVYLVRGPGVGNFALMSPRRAFRQGLGPMAGMDTTRLPDVRMVVVPYAAPYVYQLQEKALAEYAQGIKRDSVFFGYSRGWHDGPNRVLLKTSRGRLLMFHYTPSQYQAPHTDSSTHSHFRLTFMSGALPE
jgi:hypothetical protein